MTDSVKRDTRPTIQKSGSLRSKTRKIDTKRHSLPPAENQQQQQPTTPKSDSNFSRSDSVNSSIPSTAGAGSGKFKKLFSKSRHSSHSHLSEDAKKITPVKSDTKHRNSIELPPITSVRSRDPSMRAQDYVTPKRSIPPFQDQSSLNSNDINSPIDVNFAVSKSELNSILNIPVQLQPSYTQPIDFLLPNSDHSISSKQVSSTGSRNTTTDLNTSTIDNHSANGSHFDDNKGLISSFLSAAANHISGLGTPDELDHQLHHATTGNTTSSPTSNIKSVKPESKSKLGEVISTIRNFATDPNQSLEKSDSFSNHINDLVESKPNSKSPRPRDNQQQGGNKNPEILLNGVANESPITKGIKFALVKETPLSTLGKGDLSLNDFESEFKQDTLHYRKIDDNPSGTTIDRVMSPNGRLSRSLSDRPSSSPAGRRPGLSPSGLSTRFSDTVDSDIKKRSNRKSFKKFSTNTSEEADEVSTKTGDDTDTISPAVSRVMTNGQSQTRSKPQRLVLANEKRQTEFHQMFKQIPLKEKLIEDYSCALQKDILVQGRLYMSDSHLCFNSNILGWVTNFVIPFSEIIQIEKKNTAGVFPNAIIVQTLHSKSIFASFLSREATFDTMTNVWNQNIHGGKDSVIYADASDDDEDSGIDDFDDDEDDDDEDETDDDDQSDVESYNSGDEGTPMDDAEEKPTESKSSSKDNAEGGSNGGDEFNGIQFEGPKAHGPTENGYDKKSSETLIVDETVQAPIGVVYNLLFGDDPSFLRKTLEKSKNFDITDIPKFSEENGTKKRKYTYTKPLGGPIGPKQTRCIIEEAIERCDFANAVQVVQVSLSPDVPSGNSFTVKSIVLLSWGKNNGTRLVVLTSVEWTGKSWIKGAVEKGSIDGQKESMKILVAELRSRISSEGGRRRATTVGRKKSKKTKEAEPAQQLQVDEEQKPENSILLIVKMVGDHLPIPDFLKLPLAILLVTFIMCIIFFSKSSTDVTEYNSMSNIKIDGRDYILLPNSFSSRNYLANKLEYDIWEWIDKRNGLDSHIKSKMKAKSSSKDNKNIDGHSRQSLEELIKLTQYKLDELRRMLDDEK